MIAPRLRLVAITGGIGAGKSTVAAMLTLRGAVLIDADAIARTVVRRDDQRGRQVLIEIERRFGPELLGADGELDRAKTATIVFSDAEARAAYNAIVHPAIRDATIEQLDALRTSPPASGLAIHEIPLLTRHTPPTPWQYDLIVTVEADLARRAERLVRSRGYSERHARERIAAQGDESDRIAIADVVIRTDGELDATRKKVDRLWEHLRSEAPIGPADLEV